MGRMRLKRVDIPSGPVLDALEHHQVYGVPLERVFDHPAFRLAMRSVILSEGGDPDEWLGLQLAPKTRLMLAAIELESIRCDLRKVKKRGRKGLEIGTPTTELFFAMGHVESALKALGD